MAKEFRVSKKGAIYIGEVKTPVVMKRRFWVIPWFSKTVMIFQPLNKLGTPMQKMKDGQIRAKNQQVLKTFSNVWDAQAWIRKLQRGICNYSYG